MNEFKKYQHIERFGSDEVQGIESGWCFIFPKIDGTNAQLWWDGELKAGSRNRALTLENDNAGFYAWALEQENFKEFFKDYPNARLYGEWLVPHTLKTYREDAWRKFYIFDVTLKDNLLHYETYSKLLGEYGIDYIPLISKVYNPTIEQLERLVENNTYLMNEGLGEGIVIKNYTFRNGYGRQTWAKIVRKEFKLKHTSEKPITEKPLIEQEIVNKYLTPALMEKEYAKIALNGWDSKKIPQLLNTVYNCLINEEIWGIIKHFKNPTINFKLLYHFTTLRVKEHFSELF